MTDYLNGLQQYQVSGTTNPTSTTLFGGGITGANADIWTQASQLESKYSAKVQEYAKVNPLATQDVVGEFMNESLSLLFDTVYETPSRSSGTTTSSTTGQTTTPQTTTSTSETSTTQTTSTETTSQTSQTSQTSRSSSKSEHAELVQEYKSGKAGIDVEIRVVAGNANPKLVPTLKGIDVALRDPVLNLDEKVELLEYWHEKLTEKTGQIYYGSVHKDKFATLIEDINTKFQNGEVSLSETLDLLKRINSIEMKNKGERLDINDYMQNMSSEDCVNFTTQIYLEAQKAGRLDEALELISPTKAIQKNLSMGKETKAITELLKSLDDNFNEIKQTKTNYGVSAERANELDALFKELTRNTNMKAEKHTLKSLVFREIFDKKDLSDNDKMYLLQKTYKNSGKNNDQSSLEDFVKIFRKLDSESQEMYLPKLIELYSKFK